jgi:hypothetical protein
MKKVKIPKDTTGRGFVGVWRNNTAGWFMPKHLDGTSIERPESKELQLYAKGERLFLCEITVTPILDSLGRPITKIVK